MLVFGDRTRVRSPAALVQALDGGIGQVAAAPGGIGRHAALVSLLIEAGELAQGLADAAFARTGRDGPDAAADAALHVAVALARLVWRSHSSGYAADSSTAGCRAACAELANAPLPAAITVRAAEGFQHYAVYPETYALAAAAAKVSGALVIGIRTIGTTLAAAVAGALPPGVPIITVRPVGHPFERRLELSNETRAVLAAARAAPVLIADEGPGLSGSSFAAVLDALDAAGVPESNVRILPSHGGDPGSVASPRTQARWARVPRLHVPFESAFLAPDAPGLTGWTADLTGPQPDPPRDVGAGTWRRQFWPDPRDWPPVIAMRERRKFLLGAGGGQILARFVGLGAFGAAAAHRAAALAEAEFSPASLGLRHGFLLAPWLADVRPLWTSDVNPGALVARVADYLAFRADHFPADATRGAGPAALLEMARVNAGEALGPAAAARLDRFAPWLDDLARAARPIEIDGRMHAWEWLVTGDGRLLKTDAVDHCDGHDPIGCQDLAWDVAGASVELRLTGDQQAELRRRLAARGHPVDSRALGFYRATYLAFQLGLHRSGAAMAGDAAESARLDRAAAHYGALLDGPPVAPR